MISCVGVSSTSAFTDTRGATHTRCMHDGIVKAVPPNDLLSSCAAAAA